MKEAKHFSGKKHRRCTWKWAVCLCLLCGLFLTACGSDAELEAYQEQMETFFEHIVEYDEAMNSIDADDEDAPAHLLLYLDALQEEFADMAALTVPEEFASVDELADEASENMTQAVALFHQAYEGETFDANLEAVAREYYERANVRIQYIITLLNGEIPEGEDVIYWEED